MERRPNPRRNTRASSPNQSPWATRRPAPPLAVRNGYTRASSKTSAAQPQAADRPGVGAYPLHILLLRFHPGPRRVTPRPAVAGVRRIPSRCRKNLQSQGLADRRAGDHGVELAENQLVTQRPVAGNRPAKAQAGRAPWHLERDAIEITRGLSVTALGATGSSP